MLKKMIFLYSYPKERGFVLIQFLASIAFFIALLSSSMSFFSLLKVRKEANKRNQRLNSAWELEEAGEQFQHSLFTSSILQEEGRCLLFQKEQEEGKEYANLTCLNEEGNSKINQVTVLR
jgi:hypothetical protein